MTLYTDKLTVGQRDDITKAFAILFYRPGIPFQVAQSNPMKNLIKKLRPAYLDFMPSAKMIGNSLLSKEYDELFERGKSYISNARSYSLVSDGWSNLRNEHLVNFVIIIPSSKPFFFRGLSTQGVPQTSKNIAEAIITVIEELGVVRVRVSGRSF